MTLSLLWPPHLSPQAQITQMSLSDAAARDLGLAKIVAAIAPERQQQSFCEAILRQLSTDREVIQYRQAVLADLIAHPRLTEQLADLLPQIDELASFRTDPYFPEKTVLHEVNWRLGELESLVACVTSLGRMFRAVGDGLQAEGWRQLRDAAAQMEQNGTFRQLAKELPGLLEQLRAVGSITIGVNLDNLLRPVEATLVSINAEKFRASNLLQKLLGRAPDGWQGLAELHMATNRDAPMNPITSDQRHAAMNPLLIPLFRDLADILDKTCKPIAHVLEKFTRLNGQFLTGLRHELHFYLGAARLSRQFQLLGLPLCRPEIAPMAECSGQVEASYNFNLALHWLEEKGVAGRIVRNGVGFGERGRVFILTGPNQGGKTTYLQAVGLIFVLAQAGLLVPGTSARISPVDGIYSHYPVEEALEKGTGRLGDEAKRLNEVFAQATSHSLILLNETFATTSAGESLYLAQDVVRILRRMGVRAIYATHLHDLAAATDELNATTPGDGQIVSLVASPIAAGGDGSHRSYTIQPGPPLGRSYAQEIATRYGVSLEQLTSLLQKRGVLPS